MFLRSRFCAKGVRRLSWAALLPNAPHSHQGFLHTPKMAWSWWRERGQQYVVGAVASDEKQRGGSR